MMMAPLAIAAALCLATVALAEPPSGWKTCGGLPDNYSNTACDTATTTVRALSIKHCMFCAAPSVCLTPLALPCAGCAVQCATMDWQPSKGKWGCCPFPEAVQCPGGEPPPPRHRLVTASPTVTDSC